MDRYLYYYGQYSKEVFRARVSRETDSNIWILDRYNSEKKVPKKTYRVNAGFAIILYHEETSDLLEKYIKSKRIRTFKWKLDKLQSCIDPLIMDQVIAIDYPKYENAKIITE